MQGERGRRTSGGGLPRTGGTGVMTGHASAARESAVSNLGQGESERVEAATDPALAAGDASAGTKKGKEVVGGVEPGMSGGPGNSIGRAGSSLGGGRYSQQAVETEASRRGGSDDFQQHHGHPFQKDQQQARSELAPSPSSTMVQLTSESSLSRTNRSRSMAISQRSSRGRSPQYSSFTASSMSTNSRGRSQATSTDTLQEGIPGFNQAILPSTTQQAPSSTTYSASAALARPKGRFFDHLHETERRDKPGNGSSITSGLPDNITPAAPTRSGGMFFTHLETKESQAPPVNTTPVTSPIPATSAASAGLPNLRMDGLGSNQSASSSSNPSSLGTQGYRLAPPPPTTSLLPESPFLPSPKKRRIDVANALEDSGTIAPSKFKLDTSLPNLLKMNGLERRHAKSFARNVVSDVHHRGFEKRGRMDSRDICVTQFTPYGDSIPEPAFDVDMDTEPQPVAEKQPDAVNTSTEPRPAVAERPVRLLNAGIYPNSVPAPGKRGGKLQSTVADSGDFEQDRMIQRAAYLLKNACKRVDENDYTAALTRDQTHQANLAAIDSLPENVVYRQAAVDETIPTISAGDFCHSADSADVWEVLEVVHTKAASFVAKVRTDTLGVLSISNLRSLGCGAGGRYIWHIC